MKTHKSKPVIDGLWVLKSPEGRLIWRTLAEHDTDRHKTPQDAVWSSGGYDWVAAQEGQQWQAKSWKKWQASIESAKRLGWSFVEVTLTQAKP